MKTKTSTKYFDFFDLNPSPDKGKNDCSVRAICAATGKSWIEVFDLLVNAARKNCAMPNSADTIAEVLDNEGFSPCSITVKKGMRRPTMRSLMGQYPDKIIVGRCAHIT